MTRITEWYHSPMRQQEAEMFNRYYRVQDKIELDRRFDSSIGADLPSAAILAGQILNDFDRTAYGVSWWKSLPTLERILISDYLYQCANGIELNLTEAKLHHFEWLDAKERVNERIANAVSFDSRGEPHFKHPHSQSPINDLPHRLERLHLCGFFRAVGSSLDCLGALIIGVLGLPISLRYGDLKNAARALQKIEPSEQVGTQLQLGFREFLEDVKKRAGPEDWLEWTEQYRNMFVHRGRRASYHQIIPREHLFYDARGQIIPRATSKLHLARYPDRSEVEALIKGKDILLNEDAGETLTGIFRSCRTLEEETCERLHSIWAERKKAPLLIEQPIAQWKTKIRSSNFSGYQPMEEPFSGDQITINRSLAHRMLSAAVDDAHRSLWDGSKWAQ